MTAVPLIVTFNLQVVLWALSDDQPSKDAKALLESLQDQISSMAIHDVDTMENGGSLKIQLFRLNGQRVYPLVYVNGKHQGGLESLQKMASSGELKRMLQMTYPSKWGIKTTISPRMLHAWLAANQKREKNLNYGRWARRSCHRILDVGFVDVNSEHGVWFTDLL